MRRFYGPGGVSPRARAGAGHHLSGHGPVAYRPPPAPTNTLRWRHWRSSLEPVRKEQTPEDRPESVDPESVESRTAALRLVAKREHSLLSLIELSHELTLSMDFYGTADLALFNLMGQLGTSRAALWILPPDTSRVPVLLRSHGIRKQWARAIGTACGPKLTKKAQHKDTPMLVEDLEELLGSAGMKLTEECGIALFAPIHAREKLFGLIAFGNPADGHAYSQVDLQVLHASLGMLGVALENNGLYNRLLEKHRQLRIASDNMKDLANLKSEFLRNINHELRTPLTVIIAYLNFLLEQETEDSQRREFLQTISDESDKLKLLMEKLLDFSAISANNLGMEMEPGDLGAFVGTFYTDRLPGVAESIHEFSIENHGGLPHAVFDPLRVRQILDVLVDNALKFTPQGSAITLRLSTRIMDSQSWVAVEIGDDGPGIPPERLPHIFDSFRQGDGSSTRSVGGMGMGLAYARKLAENMGGHLEAKSAPGEGATFCLSLPTV